MDLDFVLGPILLAVVANAVLYGICVVQWYQYYTGRFNDPFLTRCAHICYAGVDRAHLYRYKGSGDVDPMCGYIPNGIYVVHALGVYGVKFWKPNHFPTTTLAVSYHSHLQASVPIQHFLAHRIKSLSHTWLWFFVISALSLAQGACGIAGGIMATVLSDRADLSSLIPIADAWISICVVTDVFITALLFYFLHRSKTGFRRMDSILERLILIAVETAAIGTAFCIIDVIVFNTNGNTNLHYFFALLQGRIYTNTLMVTLNSRTSLREQMNSNEPQGFVSNIGGPTTVRFKATEINVAVQHDIQMDSLQPNSPAHSRDEKESFYPV